MTTAQAAQSVLYDFIIVGSGAAGGVMAACLAQSGKRVLVLEAGKHYAPHDFPRTELQANAALLWDGGASLTQDARISLLRGKVVGGGTVVNQALLDRFDDLALSSWQHRSGIAEFTPERMQRHYQNVEDCLHLHTLTPAQWNTNARLYTQGFDQLGYRWAPLRRGQSRCHTPTNDCIVCLGGCRRQSKQSTAVTFLPYALEHGAALLDQIEIQAIVHGASHVTVQGRRHGNVMTFQARECVLCAGALGSVSLLQQSGFQAALPRLGTGFFCHPQCVTYATYADPVDAHTGSFQGVKSDDPGFRKQGFKLENVFMGPAAVGFTMPGFGAAHTALMQRYRHLACIEVAIRDTEPGVIRQRGRRQVIKKTLNRADHKRAAAGLQIIRDIYHATGAEQVYESPVQIGLHLMGGCAIGQNAATSVVNPDFQLHGYKRIYVVDGSVFPDAPGINPSLTIMALAHQAAERIVSRSIELDAAAIKQRLPEGDDAH